MYERSDNKQRIVKQSVVDVIASPKGEAGFIHCNCVTHFKMNLTPMCLFDGRHGIIFPV